MVMAGNMDPILLTIEYIGGSSWHVYHEKNSEVLELPIKEY